MSATAYVISRLGEQISIDGQAVTGRVSASPAGAELGDGGARPIWTPDVLVAADVSARPNQKIRIRGRVLFIDTVTENRGYKLLTTRANA